MLHAFTSHTTLVRRDRTGEWKKTPVGKVLHYITHASPKHFQPANITFDLLPPLDEETRRRVRDKKERHRMQCERALSAFDGWFKAMAPQPVS